MVKQTRNLYLFEDFTLDISRKCLWRTGDLVALTPKALETLLVLIKYRGSVVDKDTLLNEVWADTFVEEATLAQNISTLRRVLGFGPGKHFIETIPRRGYRFAMEVREIAAEEPAGPAGIEKYRKAEIAEIIAAKHLYDVGLGEAARVVEINMFIRAIVSTDSPGGKYLISIDRRGDDWILQMRQIEY